MKMKMKMKRNKETHYLKDARNLTKLKTAYTKVLYGF